MHSYFWSIVLSVLITLLVIVIYRRYSPFNKYVEKLEQRIKYLESKVKL